MKYREFGPKVWVEQENGKFYWVRDDERSQDFDSYKEAAEAIKTSKCRWRKRK